MTKKLEENLSVVLPKNWLYSVEESVGLPLNVYAIKNEKGETLYIRTLPKEEMELSMIFEILNKQECEKLGLKVQETYAGSLDSESYEVEE